MLTKSKFSKENLFYIFYQICYDVYVEEMEGKTKGEENEQNRL